MKHDLHHHVNHEQACCYQEHETTIFYTCPMHPEIRLTKPDNCPVCGMAKELGDEFTLFFSTRKK